MLTNEPLGHLVTAADQAYLIITKVLIYCTVVVTMSDLPTDPPHAGQTRF